MDGLNFELMPNSERWARTPTATTLRSRREGGAPRVPANKKDDNTNTPVTPATPVDKAIVLEATQLLLWDQIPAWQQEGNHWIQTGYRPVTASIKHCLISLAYLHNETVNIFSHLIGALLLFASPVYIFSTEIPPRYAVATTVDKVVCCFWFFGAATCFTLSVFYHVFLCHSPGAHSLGLKLDLQGVIVLMWGANIPLIFYGFVCDEHLRLVYWSLTTILAACCSAFTFQKRFSDPHLRPLRAATFGMLALSTFIPIGHGLVKYGYEVQHDRIALKWVLLTLLFNTIGASAYACKFPEKWYPRRFDILGASHQLMHIFIGVAAVMYSLAVVGEFDYLHDHLNQCSGA